jgi:DNA-binding winged helix-turn-helix (wHTH) protein
MRGLTDQIILANEPDFRLGTLIISPATRRVLAGDATETLQPRVMQVLVVLSRRRGEVVSRDALMARCWGGFAVSDDAIHRCIARLRRLAEAHGGFALETVPRVGYQLVEQQVPSRLGWDRVLVLAAGAAAVTLLVAATYIAVTLV